MKRNEVLTLVGETIAVVCLFVLLWLALVGGHVLGL